LKILLSEKKIGCSVYLGSIIIIMVAHARIMQAYRRVLPKALAQAPAMGRQASEQPARVSASRTSITQMLWQTRSQCEAEHDG